MPEQPPALDPEYEDLMVDCPIPGHNSDGPQPLGEFMRSDIGQKYGGLVLENIAKAEQLVGMGLDRDKALDMTFGGALQQDAEGNLVRATRQTQTEPQESPLGQTFDAPEEGASQPPKGLSLRPSQ